MQYKIPGKKKALAITLRVSLLAIYKGEFEHISYINETRGKINMYVEGGN